jgi:catechol 2,3-dioxygenase
MTTYKMPDAMMVGSIALRVKDIEKVLTFYERNLGLQVCRRYNVHPGIGIHRDGDDACYAIYELGFKGKNNYSSPIDPLLILKHDPDAKKPQSVRNAAGLFHFAILVPNRKNLALTYLAVKNSGVQYDGFADHLVSESLYLRDPEDNGIEIYRDRPVNEWPRNFEGRIIMDTLPLDLNSLLSDITTEEIKNNSGIAFPDGAKIGHVHLRVTNLERSIRFYHQKIGLSLTADWRSVGAAFLSAGGYHHHIGMNTWTSLNGEDHSSEGTGLEYLTLTIPDRSFIHSLDQNIQSTNKFKLIKGNEMFVSDPDDIPILIRAS